LALMLLKSIMRRIHRLWRSQVIPDTKLDWVASI